ncbi:S53 family peptidase [Streptomyces sp. NBC_01262]|uniref:S53 family peptidase n=1 Tax=Streptomyces sp. NBC_01262 TaxID=2903803 RepID=UPI002E2FD38E|nr:S53 family peptidase [Streptomyces sp. NBC_01262]
MSSSRTRKRRTGLALAATLPMVAGALAMGIPTVAHADAAASSRDALTGTKPAWATAKADKGATADSSKVTARVYFAGRDADGLAAYAKAVSDPSSALYGKYLTAKQANARFGTTTAQVAEVKSWLKSSGLKVTGTTARYVTVTGDVAAAEKAFSTQLHNYTKSGKTYRAPSKTASAPAALNGAVLTVTGLDNAPHLVKHNETLPEPSAVFKNSGPFSSYYGSKVASGLPSAYGSKQPYAVKGYTGTQLRAAYGAKSGNTGKGVTVAITDAFASPYITKDAKTYASKNGDAGYGKGQLTQVLPSDYRYTAEDECDAAGWYGEETLDVEAVHGVAPKSDIVYVGAASCTDEDLLDSLAKIVDNRLADIVTNSWGEAEEYDTAAPLYDTIFQQGAVEGIGFYFSSGDSGDELANSGTKQVDAPANSPWVTAVGGTSLAVGKGNKYNWETSWGTTKSLLSADGTSWASLPGTYSYGGGGGTSKLYDQPFYQRGVVSDSLALANGGTTKQRVVPDVSAVGDPQTGFLVGQSQTFPDGSIQYSEYRIGGTSLASPVFAAIQALAQQAQGGVPIGFANPSIYNKYGTSAYHDVTDFPLGAGKRMAVVRVDYANGFDAADGTITSLRSLGRDSSLAAVVGYDNATGVGSPADGYLKSFAKYGKHHGR